MDTIKFSVITPTLNRSSMLQSAIDSVLDQHYPDFEHLVMDGGSTDGTAELVKSYGHIRFFSGPDRGMYDALNKGLDLAQGEVIGFLNSDDLYGKEVFSCVAEQFADDRVQAVIGQALVFVESADGERQVVSRFSPAEADMLECTAIGSNYFNAWFFRKSVFNEIGRFDPGYRIVGDRDLTLRFLGRDLKYVTVDRLAYQYRRHPESFTFTGNLYSRRDTVDEVIRMIDGYRSNRALPPELMSKLALKRTYATVEMAVRFLKVRDFGNVFHYAWIGTRSDLRWPLRFARAVLQRPSAR